MNEVLTELIARLGQKVPELRLIDEDYRIPVTNIPWYSPACC